MTNFERVKYYYDKGWATKAQVQKYVQYGVITADEYQTIIGEPYSSAA